jgi:hypothetical protein
VRHRSTEAIPLARQSGLDARARRTWQLRLVLAASICVVAAAALVLSLRARATSVAALPQGTNGIVVLDVSASISSDTYARIASTLDDLVGSRGHYGLVLFSDTAYQALPPGTPAAELRPFARFFEVPAQGRPGLEPQLPPSRWSDSFSAGTHISAG